VAWHQSSDFLSHKLPLWHFSNVMGCHCDMTFVWHALMWHVPHVPDMHADRQIKIAQTPHLQFRAKNTMYAPSSVTTFRVPNRIMNASKFNSFAVKLIFIVSKSNTHVRIHFSRDHRPWSNWVKCSIHFVSACHFLFFDNHSYECSFDLPSSIRCF